ncbi:hypothetical protein ABT301_11550 [Streptomyces sp. NPDC000987]|uniref:hypothetical protein n=1 Tax=Streptomyces sp. NPDC000987 TaxID=3154374 RepID=UPI0033349067
MTTETELPELIETRPAPPALHADDIHIRWVMPEIFHDLPIHERDDDEAVRLLWDLADKALPGVGDEDKARFGVMCALSLNDLAGVGAEYASICLTAVDDTLCTATVLGSLVDSPEADGGVPGVTKEISAGLRRIKAGEVSEVELPCGYAVSCIGARDSRLTGDLTGTGEDITFPTWYIRVYVPLPNGTTFVLEMETPTMTGWDVFSTMFGNTVSSIRLYGTDGSRLITTAAGV